MYLNTYFKWKQSHKDGVGPSVEEEIRFSTDLLDTLSALVEGNGSEPHDMFGIISDHVMKFLDKGQIKQLTQFSRTF